MIIGFVGKMGSGKTLSMIKYAHTYYKAGYKILSNMSLSFPYEEYTLLNLLEYANGSRGFKKTIILLDEAHIFIDSRSSASKKNKIISYFLLQTRKKGCHLFYTTQRFHQVDKRLRENSDVVINCETKKYKDDEQFTLNKINVFVENGVKTSTIIFKSKPYFSLYNTYEVIKEV